MHNDYLNFRAGHLLVPMGLVNLYHEPIFFNSVYRPEIEKNIIPSTWHENGIELYGKLWEGLNYRLGVVNSLNLSNFDNKGDAKTYSNKSWIRGGRQKASRAIAEDLSYFVRLDYKFGDGNEVGAAYYTGDSRQDNTSLKSARVDLFNVHANYKFRNFKLMGLYTAGNLSDTAFLNGDLGKKVEGYYLDLSYSLKGWELPLSLFVRHSEYNLHKEVVAPVVKDLSLDKQITTLGINYKPHHQVVLKADYQIRENGLGNEANNLNLGVGFVF